jgi:hypothetical protein
MSIASNHRKFIKSFAALGAGTRVLGGISPKPDRSANKEIRFACIETGEIVETGEKSSSDTTNAGRHGQVVAMCEIDANILKAKTHEFPEAATCSDYRKMLDKMEDRMDAVTVTTPDPTPAVSSLDAMQMEKHLLCQKPSSRRRGFTPAHWALFVVSAVAVFALPKSTPAQDIRHADVVIAGGSTAALAAAFAAAKEGVSVVLLEPTDWIGGQLTASGVPAIDEAWHKIKDPQTDEIVLDVSRIARDPRNMTPFFRDMLLEIGNPGRGWVSRFCFEPRIILDRHLLPWEQRLADRLTIYRNTVVKRVERDTVDGKVVALIAIQRTPRPGVADGGYDRLPSQDLVDWYSETPSERYEKHVLRFEGQVFIEATEWGEVLALSQVDYLQGVDSEDGSLNGDDTCGQATVFGFVQKLHAETVVDPATDATAVNLGLGPYEGRENAWRQIWTYRRLLGHGPGPEVGDLSLQNWGYSGSIGHGGNDYPFGYLFLSKQLTADSVEDWRGGIDLQVLASAEQRALAWHHWFKQAAPEGIDPRQIALEPSVLGTGHGLAKLPYIRDTRRSLGLNDFVLKMSDLIGPLGAKQGTEFDDTIAIGCYPADVHPLVGYQYPRHVNEHYDTLPFNIPFRALTHRDVPNLLVAGKTMAQSFMANSATRLQPIEWSSGTAAGVIAAWMVEQGGHTADVLDKIPSVQQRVSRQTPVKWSF